MKYLQTIMLWGGLLLHCFSLSGQARSHGERLFNSENYGGALPLLLDELRIDSTDGRTNYQAGICYLNSRSQQVKAVRYLERAVAVSPSIGTKRQPGPKEASIDALPKLAEAYEYARNFDKAVKVYRRYIKVLDDMPGQEEKIAAMKQRIKSCNLATDAQNSFYSSIPARMREAIRNLDTARATYSYTTTAKGTIGVHTLSGPLVKGKLQDDRYYHPTQIILKDSTRQSKIAVKKEMKKLRPDTIINVTTLGTSPDGTELLTYRDDNGDGNLYLSKIKNNKWSVPEKIQKPVNDQGWENNECMSTDRRALYFVSNRAGGYGGKDIYVCFRQPDGGWGKAYNLGPKVNSIYDEEAPYAHPDGKTLFYCSNRLTPEVSFDHFLVSRTDSLTWNNPVVVGYPVDKNKDDAFYQVSAEGKKNFKPKVLTKKDLKKLAEDSALLFRSERENTRLTPYKNEGGLPLYVFTGILQAVPGLTMADDFCSVTVEARDPRTGELVARTHPDEKGKFMMGIPTGSSVNIWCFKDGMLPFYQRLAATNDTVPQKYNVPGLRPLKEGERTPLDFIQFDGETATLSAADERQLRQVAKFLTHHPKMEVAVHNVVVREKKNRQDKKLSAERADAIAVYLVRNGVAADRITSKGTAAKPKKKSKKGIALSVGNHTELEITKIKE